MTVCIYLKAKERTKWKSCFEKKCKLFIFNRKSAIILMVKPNIRRDETWLNQSIITDGC